MRAQSGTFYIILVALAISIALPFSLLGMVTSSETQTEYNYKKAARTIGMAADEIYRAGGGQREVYVNFPKGLEEAIIENRTIKIVYKSGEGVKEVFFRTRGSVNGSLSANKGSQRVFLSYLQGDTVHVKGRTLKD